MASLVAEAAQLIKGAPAFVHCRDADAVAALLANMRRDGPSKFQVIADFDYTLTRFRLDDGERSASTHACVEQSPQLGEDFAQRTRALFNKYYPIEVSDIPEEEKIPHMIAWWTSAHKLMMEYKLHRNHLKEMVKNSRLQLRGGTEQLFAACQSHDAPFHIFSAGLYDVIHAFLAHHNLEKLGMHVVSNMMSFDQDGFLTDFQGTLIHSLNKNSKALRDSPEWDRIKVIILPLAPVDWDNLGDVFMCKGLATTNCLRVGFLNDRAEERRAQYLDTYDIVIESDPDMSFVNELTDWILSASSEGRKTE
ncbi:uncharacterized protein MONBRDRAFT_21372 [Monosiga brevicollis MX1]|uniref:5'-nucleotidase n=1 Tax=Monosiga brevicollis TaxID=81824 RepID=A9UW86_MONBE|nr:uncharacterized protein MONBRDRAFT_21372 [Monosiga brevicollis MX1]EDQ90521.1 predicted protein [Monosiga brevicollis MX1]|eukprot:XP_001744572.1 hypothetical protein [Monosiga brevicollis MX1]